VSEMEEIYLNVIFVVVIFITGLLFGYGVGYNRGTFDEMQRRQRIQKGLGE